MARTRKKPRKLLAESLKAAKSVVRDSIVKSSDLERRHREELVNANCLTEIIKGWYLLTTPDSGGGSTAWFGGFWAFIKHYLTERFGENGFCLSAESSFNLHAGDSTIPHQIIIITKKASNKSITLPHDTSILLYMDKKNFPRETESFNGVWIMSLTTALCRLTPSYYQNNPRNVEILLKTSPLSVADISRHLLKTEAIASAEKIIGAYRYLGENKKADQIREDLVAAGYRLNVVNPFVKYEPKLSSFRSISPYAGRIRLKWHSMRAAVEDIMPNPPGMSKKTQQTIKYIQETYKEDAYHSLSIEGYEVTQELIEKIESGEWDPENDAADRKQKNALAAKGYHNAFLAVTESASKVLKGDAPGDVLENDLQTWYRQLFSPLLKANLLSPEDIVGYRNHPVYIRQSRHVPPPYRAITDCMETFFDLLKNEKNAAVRAVLGHFIFVYIHPYMDGNGRVGRFLMNLMLVSGGFNWAVIKTEYKNEYMSALEQASINENIAPFTKFIKKQLKE